MKKAFRKCITSCRKRRNQEVEEEQDEGGGEFDIQFESVNDSMRTIYIAGEIDNELAMALHDNTLKLLEQNLRDPILYHINSAGGAIEDATFSIIETLRLARGFCPVYTYAQGVAFSAATLILAAGDVGQRTVSPLSQLMVHDIQIVLPIFMDHATEFIKEKNRCKDISNQLLETYIYEIGKTRENEEDDYDEPSKEQIKVIKRKLKKIYKHGGKFLTPEEAITLGICDAVGYAIPPGLVNALVEESLSDEEEDGEEVESENEE